MMMNCLAPGHDWKWIWRQSCGPTLQEARAARKPPSKFPAGYLFHKLVTAMREAGGPNG